MRTCGIGLYLGAVAKPAKLVAENIITPYPTSAPFTLARAFPTVGSGSCTILTKYYSSPKKTKSKTYQGTQEQTN